MMKKKSRIFMYVLCALTMVVVSCNEDQINSSNVIEKVPLHIETSLSDTQTRGISVLEKFGEGSHLGLHITYDGTDVAYNPNNNNYAQFIAQYKGGKWESDAYLDQDKVNVYAYYPAEIQLPRPKEPYIRFAVNNVYHYLYGTHAVGSASSVNASNPHVKLQMKHLTGIVEFFFRKSDYTGTGKVTYIALRNNSSASSPCIPSNGHFNLITKAISEATYPTTALDMSNTNTGLVPSMSANFPSKGYQMFALTTHASNKQGDMQLRFTIDGKTYTHDLPAGTEWKGGYKYAYYVTLTSGRLQMEDVSIDSFENGSSSNLNL